MVLFNLPNRTGSVRLGMILSLWRNHSKPRICASSVATELCVAFRAVELDAVQGKPGEYFCTAHSVAWVVRLEALVSVLDTETKDSMESHGDSFTVHLTPASQDAVSAAANLVGWNMAMPSIGELELPQAADAPVQNPVNKRKRKFRASFFSAGKGKMVHVTPKPSADKSKKTTSGKKKTCQPKSLPASAEGEELEALPQNFRRSKAGRRLMESMMDKCLAVDETVFASKPMFPLPDRVCRLKNVPSAVDVTWSQVRSRASAYMESSFWKARSPDLFGNLVYREFAKVLAQLNAEPPRRDAWLALVKGICEHTAKSLS